MLALEAGQRKRLWTTAGRIFSLTKNSSTREHLSTYHLWHIYVFFSLVALIHNLVLSKIFSPQQHPWVMERTLDLEEIGLNFM